jgi:hypothetical protein
MPSGSKKSAAIGNAAYAAQQAAKALGMTPAQVAAASASAVHGVHEAASQLANKALATIGNGGGNALVTTGRGLATAAGATAAIDPAKLAAVAGASSAAKLAASLAASNAGPGVVASAAALAAKLAVAAAQGVAGMTPLEILVIAGMTVVASHLALKGIARLRNAASPARASLSSSPAAA